MSRTQSNSLILTQRLQILILAEEEIAAVKSQKLIEVFVRFINVLKRKKRNREFSHEMRYLRSKKKSSKEDD